MRDAVLERLAGLLRRLHASLARQESFWHRGLAHEAGWWERWVVEEGRRWPDEFRERLDPETPLREELILELLPSIAHDPVRVLDVGAGPATSLGKMHPERTLEIVAVDPLADEYEALWRDAGIRPPVPTKRGIGERLVERFGTAAFDIAYARNALDHMIDPLAVVEQMIAVVADSGYVVLRHSQNEATKARYRGLHQWNIVLEGSDLVVRRPRHEINLSAQLARRALLTCRQNGETVTCVISKRPAAKTPMMRRIAIVGPPAAGKSTLAARLGKALGIEPDHLDALFWNPGWRPTPPDEWEAKHRALLARSRWIVDGGFTVSMPERFSAADTVVIVDPGPLACTLRAIRRRLVFSVTRAPGMANVSRPHFDLQLFRWIWRFRRDKLPEIFSALEAATPGTRVVHVRGRSDVRRLLDEASEQATRRNDDRHGP